MSPARRRRRRKFSAPGHAHELTFSCYHRYPFLSKETTCLWLAESLRRACQKQSFDLWAYVFMPDHVHVVVYPRTSVYDVSMFLKEVKAPVSRKALAFLRREAPEWLDRVSAKRGERIESHFWQRGGGFDRNIIEPRTLETMIKYIHMNPVRRGLVTACLDWKWSSAGWFLGREPNGLRPDSIPSMWTIGMTGG